jgi:hypothetical protein
MKTSIAFTHCGRGDLNLMEGFYELSYETPKLASASEGKDRL